ncbi:hypothetical protein [Niallia sp. MER 6]|uniref:hypothetical protein n=1 Tax=unclassified Niallia TaxID=2837522 RepID=UPI00203CBD7C|nr:hypothetical protein [Niallia sp. MER 6]MCM3029254.1 hypothetical protein [Niallia sp. MER 6]
MSISVSNASAYLQMLQKSAVQTVTAQDDSIASFQDMLTASSQGSEVPVTSTKDLPALTTEQKTAFLKNMQPKAEESGSLTDTTLQDSLQTAYTTISSLLSEFDTEESTEDEISSLFEQVSDTLESAKPQRVMSIGTMPPPVISQMSEEYTVAQMSQFLSNIISSLNTEDTAEASIITDSLSSDLSGQLAGFDLESASDEQIANIFESILQELNEEQSNADSSSSVTSETISEAFPNSIQLSGSSLPPFNWKPGSSTNTTATSSASISTSFY